MNHSAGRGDHDYNKGKVFHFKQDPRTGIMIPFVPNG